MDPLQAALERAGSGKATATATARAVPISAEAKSTSEPTVASLSAALAMAGAPPKRPRTALAAMAWQPKQGIGSARHEARVQRALERSGELTRPCKLETFARAPLEPIDPNVMLSVEPPAPHAACFIPSTGRLLPCVRDESGAPVLWPWEQGGYLEGGMPTGGASRPVRAWHRLDDSINHALDQASRDGKRGRTHTGVKAWFSFCEDTMGTQAERPLDPNEPLWVKLEEEWLAMRFVIALVEERGVSPETARQYFSSVQGWHAREHGIKLAGGLKLERLPQMLKGLRRIIGEAPRAVRRGIAPQALKKAMDLVLDPSVPAHANMRAALATALQGLLRSAEFCGDKVNAKLMLTRADLVQLTDDLMILMMHPCKNMHHLGGKTCPLVIGAGGEFVDAVKEVRNMLAVDPHDAAAADATPLFRDPATNRPLSYDAVLGTTKELMAAIGEDPAQFGTHSYRIGGATALFAAGANETVIRTMGRWSSDLHRLYVRACFEQCVDWTKRAGSAAVSDLAGTFDEVEYY